MVHNEVWIEKPFAARRAMLQTMLGPDGTVAVDKYRLQIIQTYPGGMYRELFGGLDLAVHDGVCFKLASVYAGGVIKFKPQKLQSIDFRVRPVEALPDREKHSVLIVGTRDGLVPFEDKRVPFHARFTKDCIAEYRYEAGQFEFVKLRPDKTKPNTEYVAKVTYADMQRGNYEVYYHGLLDEKLQNKPKIVQGSISQS
ncbi:hypothetical protein SARC_03973 [Sphaeroforma arctica JP610]|uniref:Uncharacterized protein n=1 Tax=Sphaeroforma arctica JP610 TaxID=667725 RepID=A0A0L0G3W3_9EUKA|nr:hypothetical protein SARC_03973 [Sphaeroforma arctica JP610]KNC83797.1 hypothetical protein SARC_03973 [Sphaeroforma arctica JP610]|eukprot:XP_014157699.1 hypothetical protein SARC_03973 [Sphaeroforma arctica JP610]